MNIVGMIGGLGPESTVDYYRRVLEAWQRHEPFTTTPSIVVDSLDVGRAICLAEHDRPGLTDYLLARFDGSPAPAWASP